MSIINGIPVEDEFVEVSLDSDSDSSRPSSPASLAAREILKESSSSSADRASLHGRASISTLQNDFNTLLPEQQAYHILEAIKNAPGADDISLPERPFEHFAKKLYLDSLPSSFAYTKETSDALLDYLAKNAEFLDNPTAFLKKLRVVHDVVISAYSQPVTRDHKRIFAMTLIFLLKLKQSSVEQYGDNIKAFSELTLEISEKIGTTIEPSFLEILFNSCINDPINTKKVITLFLKKAGSLIDDASKQKLIQNLLLNKSFTKKPEAFQQKLEQFLKEKTRQYDSEKAPLEGHLEHEAFEILEEAINSDDANFLYNKQLSYPPTHIKHKAAKAMIDHLHTMSVIRSLKAPDFEFHDPDLNKLEIQQIQREARRLAASELKESVITRLQSEVDQFIAVTLNYNKVLLPQLKARFTEGLFEPLTKLKA